MKITIIILKKFVYIWLALAILLILFCLIGIWIAEGFPRLLEVIRRYKVVHFFAVAAAFAPAAGAFALSRCLQSKLEKSEAQQENNDNANTGLSPDNPGRGTTQRPVRY
jgi:hypothetical protein